MNECTECHTPENVFHKLSCSNRYGKREANEPSRTPLENALDSTLDEIALMMKGRHQKYGPGNIAKHGPVGILVRMDDKFARLEAGQGNFDDETIENTLDDIIGYALIWKLWLRGEWPGSPKENLRPTTS